MTSDEMEARLVEALLILREVEARDQEENKRGDTSTFSYLDVAQFAIQRMMDPGGEAAKKFIAAGGGWRNG